MASTESATSEPIAVTPSFTGFTVAPAVESWNVTSAAHLATKPFHPIHIDGIGTGILVFSPSPNESSAAAAANASVLPRVLVVRRAFSDSMPGLWEVPGGAVDATDPSLLAGAARELFEEAGLHATAFLCLVPGADGTTPGWVFPNRSRTKIWAKYSWMATVADDELPTAGRPLGGVRLDPNEHIAAAWATEEEVAAEMMADGTKTPFTTPAQRTSILRGFRLWKEIAGLT